MSNERVIGFIFARGGSKGIPRKNLKLLGGKPLIAHSIDIAKACPSIESVIVSTDDDAIADVSRKFGADVPFMRPGELATDKAPEWLAWRHAIRWHEEHRGKFDIFLSLPTTSPFRNVADVESCIACLRQDTQADIVVTATEASRSPYFNMVRMDGDGYAHLVMNGREYAHRQDVPAVYDLTTVAYAARPGFVLSAARYFDGRVRMVQVPPERAIDIDTPLDFEIAEFLASRRPAQAL